MSFLSPQNQLTICLIVILLLHFVIRHDVCYNVATFWASLPHFKALFLLLLAMNFVIVRSYLNSVATY